MEVVKTSGDYKILKKRSGRYGVKGKDGKWLNGAEKAQLLAKEGLIKLAPAKKKEEPAAEAPAEASPEEKKEE